MARTDRSPGLTRGEQWLTKLNAVVEFIHARGCPPSQSADDPGEKSLAWWILIQRRQLNRGTLSAHRAALLDHRLPGWRQTAHEKSWQRQLSTVLEFLEQNGRYPKQSSPDTQERALALWVDGQRQRHKNGKLSAARVRALEATPGWQWEVVKRHGWDNNLNALVKFYEVNQRPPSYRPGSPEEWRLHKWLMRQKESLRKGKLSRSRADQLDDRLPGWFAGSSAPR